MSATPEELTAEFSGLMKEYSLSLGEFEQIISSVKEIGEDRKEFYKTRIKIVEIKIQNVDILIDFLKKHFFNLFNKLDSFTSFTNSQKLSFFNIFLSINHSTFIFRNNSYSCIQKSSSE